MLYGAQPSETNVQVESRIGDLSTARRHALENSCTVLDPATNTYKFRSVTKTTLTEIGEYGLGLMQYFDFVKKTGWVIFFMAILSTATIATSYLGDFAGVTAGVFAKTTIGNIGVCGQYGELCPQVASYPYRFLLTGHEILVRDWTRVFGALAATATAIFVIYMFWFYYSYQRRARRIYDERHVTPTDYALEVDLLPHRLGSEAEHLQYETLLREHFEKVAGNSGSVVEVAIARDYGGAIRKFLKIHELTIQIREIKAQIKRAPNATRESQLLKQVRKLEEQRASCESAVAKEAIIDENARSVCKAFIIFSESRYKKRVIEAYKLSHRGFLFRLIQSSALRFRRRAIRVRETCEPPNVYHENLDLSRFERWLRKGFTILAAISVLVIAFMLLLFAQIATRSGTAKGVGNSTVWVLANSSRSSGLCLETCGVEFFADPNCHDPLNATVIGVFESSGLYTAGLSAIAPVVHTKSPIACNLDNIWRSDRCSAVEAHEEPWLFETPGTVTPPRSGNLVQFMAGDSIRPASAPRKYLKRFSTSVQISGKGTRNRISLKLDPLVILPDSSSICPASFIECATGNDPMMCFEPTQRCDGVRNCLVSGFDEQFDSLGNPCNTICPASSPAKCPTSGLCVNHLTETCGTDCESSALSSSAPTCTVIQARLEANSSLPVCQRSVVAAIMESNFAGNCPNKFIQTPCCVIDQLSNDQRTMLSSCSASSVFDDIFVIDAGLSALGYMEGYCRSFELTAAEVEENGFQVCLNQDVNMAIAMSPNCYAAMEFNRRWCECLEDLALLPDDVIHRLERCQVAAEEFEFFAIQKRFNHLNNLVDVVRLGCGRSGVKTGDIYDLDEFADNNSPLLVLGTTIPGFSNATELLHTTITALESINIEAYVRLSAGEDGTLRIEINDRSDNIFFGQAVWNQTVLAAHSAISAKLSDVFPTKTGDKVRVSMEPHCPDSPEWFQCPVTRRCLSADYYVCDGVPDCEIVQDGEPAPDDELDCYNSPPGVCQDYEFQCTRSMACIPNLFWCDGIKDCSDNSDETGTDCESQKKVRELTNSTSALEDAHQAMEFIGFHFDQPVQVQCVSIKEPEHSLSSVLDMYACNEEVVFREGKGLVLRFPDLNCIKVQSAGIRPDPSNPVPAVLNPSNTIYNVFGPNLNIACDSESNGDDCPILTGRVTSYCDPNENVCKYPVASEHANFTVLKTAMCDFGSPISPSVASVLVLNHTDPITGEIDSKGLLTESTYTCFCDQQTQYQSLANPLFAYPPYSTDIQLICSTYFDKVIRDTLLRLVGIVVVSVVNIILTAVMYWLSDLEHASSLTEKGASELWKLFLAQFTNAGLLVLIVNGRFYDSRFTFAGLGEGDYPDTTREWFANIGSSLCLSMFLLIFTNTVPFLLWEGIARWLRRRNARRQITQEAMNRASQLPDFMLSLRVAGYITVLAVTVMYAGPMPIMLWTMALTSLVVYWYDKYFFLRCCARPPMHSDSTMVICLRLMPIVVVLNLAFMIWTMASQEVFPSDVVNQSWYDSLGAELDENSVLLYITGRLSFLSKSGNYETYIRTRLIDSFRQAPFGGVIVLGLVVVFFAYRLIWFVLSITIFAVVNFLLFLCGCMGRKRMPQNNMLRRAYSSLMGRNVEDEGEVSFDKALDIMKQTNMLHSYKLQEHPKYKAAYAAMNRVRKRQSVLLSAKQAEIAAAAAIQAGQVPVRAKDASDDSSDGGLEDLNNQFASPQVDKAGSPRAYPSLDEANIPGSGQKEAASLSRRNAHKSSRKSSKK